MVNLIKCNFFLISNFKKFNFFFVRDESSKTAESGSGEKMNSLKENDLQPLFFKTPNSGFYTVIPGNNSSTRLNAFRNVGRY